MTHNAPAMARGDGTTVIAERGGNYGLKFYWNNDGEQAWTDYVIGGPGTEATYATPAMTRGDNSTLIAVQGPNNSLDFWWNSDGDSEWHRSVIAGPGTAYSTPAICRGFDLFVGGTIVAVLGPKHHLHVFWNIDGDPTWHPLQVTVAPVHSAPSIAYGGSSIAVLFLGEKGSLHFAAGSVGSGAILEEIGKDTAPLGASSPPALTFNGNGWLQVAVQGLDQSLDYYWMPSLNLASPTWNLSQIAGPESAYSAPAMARTGGATVVAAQGPNNSLSFYWNKDGDTTWNSSIIAGPESAYSAPALARADGATVVAARGPNDTLNFYWNKDGDSTWNSSIIGSI
jgi:hypothetical protein